MNSFLKSSIHSSFFITFLSLFLSANVSSAQEAGSLEIPDINVGITPMPGTGISVDKVPTKVQTLNPSEYNETYSVDLPALLNSKAASIDATDTQNNPFQNFFLDATELLNTIYIDCFQ